MLRSHSTTQKSSGARRTPRHRSWLFRVIPAGLAAALLAGGLTLTPPVAIAATDPANVGATSTETLTGLGFNPDEQSAIDVINNDDLPYGQGTAKDPVPFSVNQVPDLFSAYTTYDGKAYANHWSTSSASWVGERVVYGLGVNPYTAGDSCDAMRSVALDPTGSGFKDYVAVVCAKIDSKASTSLYLDVYNKNGRLSNTWFSSVPFVVNLAQAGAFLSLAAGDFNGDGRDELAVYSPQDPNENYPTGPNLPTIWLATVSDNGPGVIKRYSIDMYGDFQYLLNNWDLDGDYYLAATHYVNDFPAVDMTVAKQPGRAADLIVAVSPSRGYAMGIANSGTRVAVLEQPLTPNPEAPYIYKMKWPLSAYDKDGLAGQFEEMMFGGVSAGDINNDGIQSVVIAGNEVADKTLVKSGLATVKGEYESTSDGTAVYLATYLNFDASKGTYLAPQPGQRVSTGDTALNKMMTMRIWNDNNPENILPEPVEVTCFAERGTGFGDSVFVGGLVLALQKAPLADGSTSPYGTLQSMAINVTGSTKDVSSSNAFPNPFVVRYGVNTGAIDWWVSHSYNYAKNNLFTEAVAGNFDNNPFGKEQLVYSYLLKRDVAASSKSYWWTATGQLSYQPQGDASVKNQADGSVENVGTDFTWGENVDKTKDLQDKTRIAASVAAPEFSHRSTIMKFDASQTPSYYFSDPSILAVLQAAPKFSQLAAQSNGYTTITRSQGSGTSESHAASLSVSAWVGVKMEEKTLGPAMELSAKITESVSIGYQHDTSYEVTFSTGFTAGETDQVVLTMTPYIRYPYLIWSPTAGWAPASVNVPLEPQIRTIPVADYDAMGALATANGTKGWSPLTGHVLKSTPGDPASYVNALGDAVDQSTWMLSQTVSGSGQPVGGNYLTVGVGTGGSSSAAIDITKTVTNTVTWGASYAFSEEGGIGLALAGSDVMVMAGFEVKAEYTGSYGWAKMTGTTYSGTVPNLPDGTNSADYIFDFQFGFAQALIDEQSFPVLAYKVRNVRSLPAPPTNLSVEAVTSNSVTLSWKAPGNASSTTLYRTSVSGDFPFPTQYPINATDGTYTFTDTGLKPSTAYQYYAKSTGPLPEARLTVPSATVTAVTLPTGGGPVITGQPQDTSAVPGYDAHFNVAATNAPGATSDITYQWQTDSGTGWQDIAGQTAASLTLSKVTLKMSGTRYRCIVRQLVDGDVAAVYSSAAKLRVGPGATTTTLGVTPASGQAGHSDQAGSGTVTTPQVLTATFAGQVYAVMTDGAGGYYLSPDRWRFFAIDPADLPAIKTAAGAASSTGTPQDRLVLTTAPVPITGDAPLIRASDSSDTGVSATIFNGAATDGAGAAKTFDYSLSVDDYTQWSLYDYGGNYLYSVMLDQVRYFCDSYYCGLGGQLPEVFVVPGNPAFVISWGDTAIPVTVIDAPGTQGTTPLAVTSGLTTEAYASFTDGTHTVYHAAVGEYDLYWLDGTGTRNQVVLGPVSSYSAGGVPLPGFEPSVLTSIVNGVVVNPDTSLVGGWLFGDPVALRAAVSDASGNQITPTGSVTFIMTNTDTGAESRLSTRLDATGVATTTWTPDSPGHYSITARYTGGVTSAGSTSQPGSYFAYVNGAALALAGGTSLTVGASMDLAPTLTTTTGGVTGQPVPVQVTYTVKSGTQDLSSSGLIVHDVFTPLKSGTYAISAKYADATGSYTATKSVVVVDVATAPSITTTALDDAMVYLSAFGYSATLAATGTTPITWSLSSGVLPDGWSLNASTGVISGLPRNVGTYHIGVTATNRVGSDTKILTLALVTPPGQPVITGPTSMTLTEGYPAGQSTAPYTITGEPAPTTDLWEPAVGLTWNDSTKRLDVADGLPPGTYQAIIHSVNGVAQGTMLWFTLTVTSAPVAPGIGGPTAMTLLEGYDATSTNTFMVSGTDPVVVTTTGDPLIAWNDVTKRLDVAAGLAAGSYPVRLAASNGVSPDATLDFTLTVTGPPVAPAITGQTAMTLAAAYSPASSDAFTVTGTAPVTVTKTAGDPAITWNDATRKLDIEPGLAPGTYPVTLTASNGVPPDATLDFTLTVVGPPKPTAPTITGPPSLTLPEGYAATASDVFTVGGSDPVTVTKTAGDAKITWNDATRKLDIAAGLDPGTYPVTLTAANGTPPEATATFTLTVSAAPTYQVSVTSAGTGASGDGKYAQGAVVSIDAGGAPVDTTFAGWTASGPVTFADPAAPATSFVMPGEAVTVTAHFTSVGVRVDAVSVDPATATAGVGFGASFSAVVTGPNNPPQDVTWSVTVGSDAATSIATDGRLSVGLHETASTLTVTATSVADPAKKGSATVTVQQPSPAARDVIDGVLALPDPVLTWADADAVAAVTKALAALSDAEKAQVPQGVIDRLTTAQSQAGPVNHADVANGATIVTGNLDWSIRLVLTPVPASDPRFAAVAAKLPDRTLLVLYDATLLNTLTGQPVQLPAGQAVSVALTKVPLAGATHVGVVHLASGGALETVPATVTGGTVTFTGSQFSLYGVTAAKPATGGRVDTGGTALPASPLVPGGVLALWLILLGGAVSFRVVSVHPVRPGPLTAGVTGRFRNRR